MNALFETWKSAPQTGRRFVGFGSSNTELTWHNLGHLSWFCWLSCSMRIHVGKHVAAINCGICGNTSQHLLDRLDRDVTPLAPSFVLVTIGGNDFWHLTRDQYDDNLRALAARLQALGAATAFQTYYCPMFGEQDLARFDSYMDVVRTVAPATNSILIDNYAAFRRWWTSDPASYRQIMLDDMHLKPMGHALFGALCCRSFGLPNPEWPPDARAEIVEQAARLF